MPGSTLSSADRATLTRLVLLLDEIAGKRPETPTSTQEFTPETGGIEQLEAALMDYGVRLQVHLTPETYGLTTDEFGDSAVYEEVVDGIVAAARTVADIHGWTKYFEHHEVTRESEALEYGEFASRFCEGTSIVEVRLSFAEIPDVNRPLESESKESEKADPDVPLAEMAVQELGEYADAHPDNADAAAELMKRELENNSFILAAKRKPVGGSIVLVQAKNRGLTLTRFQEDYKYNINYITSADETNMELPHYEGEASTVIKLRVQGLKENYTGRGRPDL